MLITKQNSVGASVPLFIPLLYNCAMHSSLLSQSSVDFKNLYRLLLHAGWDTMQLCELIGQQLLDIQQNEGYGNSGAN